MFAAACSTNPEDESGPTMSGRPEATIPSQLEGFSQDVVLVDGEAWTVAVADTRELRQQGLMGVEDLGSLDGMLFVFADDTTAQFHMADTLIPLDIAFFTATGTLVSTTRMLPCVTDSCPDYESAGPYRYALEAPAGALSGLELEARLAFPAG